ncbi:predicted protein [Thalassiosira pseudonana CCMP1335]|uniref:Ion transport domain-containing protein n=1 Tax=Thalassiosira pseudonana TaxID=35128 RepID=B8C2Z1_THAPS|nr:predicted protein [Thalassiosira pseudonana CCMP1335]EED92466.1 predicted protein [Thalassiosira pseudonana CCMP1335]
MAQQQRHDDDDEMTPSQTSNESVPSLLLSPSSGTGQAETMGTNGPAECSSSTEDNDDDQQCCEWETTISTLGVVGDNDESVNYGENLEEAVGGSWLDAAAALVGEEVEKDAVYARDNTEHDMGSLQIPTQQQQQQFLDPFPSPTPSPLPPMLPFNEEDFTPPDLDDNSRSNQSQSRPNSARQSSQRRRSPRNSRYSPRSNARIPNSHNTQQQQQQSQRQTTSSPSNVRYTTPPFTPFSPHVPQTPLLSTATLQTPVKAPLDVSNKSWTDPFPTPDASVHSRYSRDSSDNNDDHDHWEMMLPPIKPLPSLPTHAELDALAAVRHSLSLQSDQKVGKKTTPGLAQKRNDTSSCPRLQSMGVNEFPIRRTSSVNDLPPLMSRVPSMEDFWRALQTGPDGNELLLNSSDGEDDDAKKKKRQQRTPKRRNTLSAQVVADTHRSFFQGRSDVGTLSKNEALKTPMDEKRPLERRATGSNARNTPSAATLTSVAGADLAKEIRQILDVKKKANDTMTPNRHSWKGLQSPSVRHVEELVFTPVRNLLAQQGRRASLVYRNNSARAAKIVRKTQQRLKEQKELRRKRRMERIKQPPPSWWIVIPADHPYKIAWDVMTMIWALLGGYRTHLRIRDRVFEQSPLILITEMWFALDILLNFVTEHKTSKGEVIRDGKAVWARYLTTWFVIDLLSLMPWEHIYVKPVVEKIKRRNIFQKTFFRSKAVVRVSRVLRGRHIKLFGRVSKQTGTPLRRLVGLVIKYLPKYLLFFRHMKGALFVRLLRFVHWLHNMYKKIWVTATEAGRAVALRRRRRHPIFGLGDINENEEMHGEDDDGTSDDDHDEHSDQDDDTQDDDTQDDDEGSHDEVTDDSTLLDDITDYDQPSPLTTPTFRRHSSDVHPSALRRRSFSQGM